MNYETYEAGIQLVIRTLNEDYARWANRAGINLIAPPKFVVFEGRNYDKVVKIEERGQQSVVGFICKKDNPKKGFFVGDMLKAASWSAPATNFSRGNIGSEASVRAAVQWAGIG